MRGFYITLYILFYITLYITLHILLITTKIGRKKVTTYFAAFSILEILVMMIVVIEVVRRESNVMVVSHLTHECLLPLYLHLFRVQT